MDKTKTTIDHAATTKQPYLWQKLGFRLFMLFVLPTAVCIATLYLASEHEDSIQKSYDNVKNFRNILRGSAYSLSLEIHDAASLVTQSIKDRHPAYKERFHSLWEQMSRNVNSIEKYALHSQNARLQKSATDIRKSTQEFATLAGEVFAFPNSDRASETSALRDITLKFIQKFLAEADVVEVAVFDKADQEIRESYSRITRFVILALFFSLLITIHLSWSVMSRINTLSSNCKDLSSGAGDLTKRFRLKENDEIGFMAHYLDLFLEKTYQLVATIATAAKEVLASTQEMNQLTQKCAEGTNTLRKNSALEQLSTDKCQIAVEKLELGMKVSNERINRTVTLALEGETQAQQGAERIANAFNKIKQVLEHTKQINYMIGHISDIASQTQVLSINASIEAVKAGEHGKGFYTVADEIRQLSEKIQHLTEEMNNFLANSEKEVTEGTEQARIATETLDRMVGTINTVSLQVQDLNQSTQEYSQHVTLVSEQMGILIKTVTSNAQSTDAVSKHTKSLSTEASHLNDLMEQLNQMVHQFKLQKTELPHSREEKEEPTLSSFKKAA